MSTDSHYHHGDLRAALLKTAAAEIERVGYETLSLRELAGLIGVSRAAPYRHFADRRALLAALAADGFAELTAIYRKILVGDEAPAAQLAEAGRAYLAFAERRPQLFRLMFVSDLFSRDIGPPDPQLIAVASECYQVFEGMVAATLGDADESSVKAATIACMSSTYGFALLRMYDRLKPFMYGRLTQKELIDAVLSVEVKSLPHGSPRGRSPASRRNAERRPRS